MTTNEASEGQEVALQETQAEASGGVLPETQEPDWRSVLREHQTELLQEPEFNEEINRRAQSQKDKELLVEHRRRQRDAENKRLQELADMDETDLGELVKRDPEAARLLSQRLPVPHEVIEPILRERFEIANRHLLGKLSEERQRIVLAALAQTPEEEQSFQTFADMVIEAVSDMKAEEKAKKLADVLADVKVTQRLAGTRSGEHSPDLLPGKSGSKSLDFSSTAAMAKALADGIWKPSDDEFNEKWKAAQESPFIFSGGS